jgi:hypothetical protein
MRVRGEAVAERVGRVREKGKGLKRWRSLGCGVCSGSNLNYQDLKVRVRASTKQVRCEEGNEIQ